MKITFCIRFISNTALFFGYTFFNIICVIRNEFHLQSLGCRPHNSGTNQMSCRSHYHCSRPKQYYSRTVTTLYFELEMYCTTYLALQYYASLHISVQCSSWVGTKYQRNLEIPLCNFYGNPQWGLLVNFEGGLLPKPRVGVCLRVKKLEHVHWHSYLAYCI